MALVKGTNCGFVSSAPSEDPNVSNETMDNKAVVNQIATGTPPTTVKITEIGWWCDNATQEANFEVGIYDDDGEPNNLLDGASLTNAKGTTAGWKRAVGLNITITPETVYGIGLQLDNTSTTTRIDYATSTGDTEWYKSASALPNPWDGILIYTNSINSLYAVWEAGAAGTNMKVNIADAFKDISEIKVNIGDVWKDVTKIQINIADVWKTVFG